MCNSTRYIKIPYIQKMVILSFCATVSDLSETWLKLFTTQIVDSNKVLLEYGFGIFFALDSFGCSLCHNNGYCPNYLDNLRLPWDSGIMLSKTLWKYFLSGRSNSWDRFLTGHFLWMLINKSRFGPHYWYSCKWLQTPSCIWCSVLQGSRVSTERSY